MCMLKFQFNEKEIYVNKRFVDGATGLCMFEDES